MASVKDDVQYRQRRQRVTEHYCIMTKVLRLCSSKSYK